MDATLPPRRRMTTFAAVGAGLIGIWHVISGIAGITSADGVETVNEALFGIDLTIFGWFWLVVGVAQVATAVGIHLRNPVGRVAGVVWASISATMAVFVIFPAPVWALVVIGLNAVVIRALLVDPGFEEL